MTSNFFHLFLLGNYEESSQVALSYPHDSYIQQHSCVASVLTNPNSSIEDILSLSVEPKVLELVSLRCEIGFDYNNAIKLRQAIQQKNPTLLNLLSVIDISLRLKPLNECGLEIFDHLDLENEKYMRLCNERLLSIIGFVASNYCLAALPKVIIEKASALFNSQIKSQDKLQQRVYYNLAQLLFYLREYEQSLTYFRKLWEVNYLIDSCAEGIIRCLTLLDRYSESFNFVENLLSKAEYKNKFRLYLRYSQLLSKFGLGDKCLDNLDIAYELLIKEVRQFTSKAYIFHAAGNYNLANKYYYRIIAVLPVFNQICTGLAGLMKMIGGNKNSKHKDIETIDANIEMLCRQAKASIPTSYDAAIATSILLNWNNPDITEAGLLVDAIKLAPDSAYIAYRLFSLLGSKYLGFKEQICLHFLKYDDFENKPEFMLQLGGFYLSTGFILEVYQIMDYFQEFLFNEVDSSYISYSRCLLMYLSLGFVVPSVRDDVVSNSLILSTLSLKLKEKLVEWKNCVDELHQINYTKYSRNHKNVQRIAFISPHFRGHVVSLFSIDVIKELSLIEGLEVLLIPTDGGCRESKFLENVKQIPSITVVEIYETLPEIIKRLAEMNLDVLIDIDGLTSMQAVPILYAMPAVVNCTWLGFDAPYISEKNYFLCDQYTHPEGVDDFYEEKLIRLPHSHMCVGSLGVVDKDRQAVRKELGLSDDQIVFIYPAAVRKFNFNIAIAHAQILSRVPNSILMVKTSGGHINRPLEVWKEEFSVVGVSHDRVIFIPLAETPEEHRFYFKVADVYLDAYPYNGGSQTVEALWCDLPVVTYCGEQSFARMGYSFLSTAGITEGIAHSWEEYIEWAVRLATDRDLRLSIKERLAKGKDPDHLCPLWNPKQFARDMYNILQELYEQAEV